MGRTWLVLKPTYIADVDSIGLGQNKAGGVGRHVEFELVIIPDFPIFPLSEINKKD